MTSLLSARKRADEFQAVLDGDQTHRPELAELATVATALREHAPATPRPDFTASLREQLMVEAATVLNSGAKVLALPTGRRGARERRLVAAATAVVFVGGTAGMAAASQSALPGDALYPIKRAVERAQAELNTNDAGRGQDLLGQADDRLAEVQALVEKPGAASPQVSSTIEDFAQQAQQATDLMAGSFEQDRDPQTIASVRSFAARSLAVLQELAKVAPPEAQEALAGAAVQLQQIDQQMLNLCASCASELPPLQLTNVLLLSSSLRDAIEAAAKADNSRVRAGKGGSAKPGTSASAPPSTTEPPTKAPLPTLPGTTGVPGTGNVPGTTGDVQDTVDTVVDPLQQALDGLVPGAGTLVGDVAGGLTEGLLGGG